MRSLPPVSPPTAVGSAIPGLRLRLGVLLSLLLLLAGFVSVVWTPLPLDQLDLAASMQGPSAAHLLGVDTFGRDVLSLAMKAMLTSFVVTTVGLALGLFVGVPLGAVASLAGPWADRAMEGVAGVLLALSALGIAAVLFVHLGPSALNAMLAIGLFNIAVVIRATRRLLGDQRGRDDIAAAHLAGLRGWELVRRHMLAELLPDFGRLAALLLAGGVLLEAALSFVGLAAPPGGASLGLMLREARPVMMAQPLLILVPAAALTLIALGLHLIAAGLDRRQGVKHAA